MIISEDYYGMPMQTIKAEGIIDLLIKPNKYGDLKNLYTYKLSMDKNLIESKLSTSVCWDRKYQPLTTDMTKDKNTGRYHMRLCSILVPDSSPF